MNRLSSAFLVLAVLLLAGCATSERERPVSTYERDRVGEVERVERGTIVSLTPVNIEENDSNVGTVVGAVAGGLAGRQVGSGSGSDIMTIIGAVAGGYAGSRYGDDEVRAEGAEIGLEMEDGSEISIVQDLDENEEFRVGEEVRVVFTGDKARVTH